MNRTVRHKIGLVSVFCIAITALAFHMPMTCQGEEYQIDVEFSPNIINIESIRVGDIRILTSMRFSTYFAAESVSISVYFNECSESVQNITAYRDSLGRLYLRFALEELIALQKYLVTDGSTSNTAEVVVVMENGDEYKGEDEVFINAKKAEITPKK